MPLSSPSSDLEHALHRGAGKKSVLGHLGNRFLAGFAVAIPLIITIWLLVLTYRFILFVGEPLINLTYHGINLALGRSETAGNLLEPAEWFVNVFGIITPILIFIALGVMATNVLGAKVIHLFERLLLKFPFISAIYSGLKQMMDSFRNFGGAKNFKRVAYIEYPAPGCRLLGFVTGQYFDPQIGKPVTSVFIPTAPNPMTGFVVVVDNEDLIESTLTTEQASKIILSAGLVTPTFGPAAPAPEVKPEAPAPVVGKVVEAPPTPAQKLPLVPPVAASGPERYSFVRKGIDPVVRHEREPVAAGGNHPASAAFDGLTGYEDDQF